MTNNTVETKNHNEVFSEIIQHFPNEILDLFFKGYFGVVDFSSSQMISTNFSSRESEKDIERKLPSIIQTAVIKQPGFKTTATGDVLFLWEPYSDKWSVEEQKITFNDQMYMYYVGAGYHYGATTMRIPIALFYKDAPKDIETFQEEKGLGYFNFYKINLHDLDWKAYQQETNPVAAAFLGLMDMKEEEKVLAKVAAHEMLLNFHKEHNNLQKSRVILKAIQTFFTLNDAQFKQYTSRCAEVFSTEEHLNIMQMLMEQDAE
ncbi:hypothetical protein U8V72_22155 [Priestia filamentosa]|uniref:hypothetical protein n=1 Tax=Priestia filamentosa TaxID=1402861 RepID=UPI003979A68C